MRALAEAREAAGTGPGDCDAGEGEKEEEGEGMWSLNFETEDWCHNHPLS